MLDTIVTLLGSTVRISLPIILCALGAMFCERAGVLNIGMEGIMLLGAFFGAYGSYISGNAYVGLFFALATGSLLGLLHGVLTVKFHTNHIINGVAINLLGDGLSILLLVIIWGNKGKSTEVVGFRTLDSIIKKDIPVFSTIFGNLNFLFLLMLVLVIISYFFIFKTPLGLRLRVIGDKPQVADTMGINVERAQIIYVVIGSAIASIAGASLSIGSLHYFSKGMVAGRGYMALAAMVFGMWHPVFILLSGLFFGFVQAVQMRLQLFNFPVQFIEMIPYVVTIAMLVLTSKTNKGPQNAGKPFQRGIRE
ncbi:MAG: ABC transporter permease [Sphaerochaetaceae bacterium]|nr:ABC transporter permease [Sphaerochaetaceae bacterium]